MWGYRYVNIDRYNQLKTRVNLIETILFGIAVLVVS